MKLIKSGFNEKELKEYCDEFQIRIYIWIKEFKMI